MIIKKGYKDIRIVDGHKMSIINTPGSIRYCDNSPSAVGPWIYPRNGCGPLTVFAKEEQATQFAEIRRGIYEIWYIEYKPAPQHEIWYIRDGKKISQDIDECPKGTKLAYAVRLIQLIDIYISTHTKKEI
jgi:hypothetical protein